jgi:hypothetical protein
MFKFGPSSGLIVPLHYFVKLLTGKRAEEFEDHFDGYFDLFLRLQNMNDDDLKAHSSFSRECVDFMTSHLFPIYYRTRSEGANDEDAERPVADAFEQWCVESDKLLRETHVYEAPDAQKWIMSRVLKDTFGKNTIPSVREILTFDGSWPHEDPWIIHGLLNSWDDLPDGMTNDEFVSEIHHKPCLVFDLEECFQITLSDRGKRFEQLLGVSCFQPSYWDE